MVETFIQCVPNYVQYSHAGGGGGGGESMVVKTLLYGETARKQSPNSYNVN